MTAAFLGAEAGVGADFEFGELGFGIGITGGEDRAEPSGDETDRDGDDAGIAQRERSVGLAEDAVGAEQNQHDRGDKTHREASDGARGVEALPEHAEYDHRQVR